MGPPAGASERVTPYDFPSTDACFCCFLFLHDQTSNGETEEMTNYGSSLKKGDKVITTGGVYGRIYEVKDNYVTVDVGGDVKLRIDKRTLFRERSFELTS